LLLRGRRNKVVKNIAKCQNRCRCSFGVIFIKLASFQENLHKFLFNAIGICLHSKYYHLIYNPISALKCIWTEIFCVWALLNTVSFKRDNLLVFRQIKGNTTDVINDATMEPNNFWLMHLQHLSHYYYKRAIELNA